MIMVRITTTLDNINGLYLHGYGYKSKSKIRPDHTNAGYFYLYKDEDRPTYKCINPIIEN